jgi:hypothetical protein
MYMNERQTPAYGFPPAEGGKDIQVGESEILTHSEAKKRFAPRDVGTQTGRQYFKDTAGGKLAEAERTAARAALSDFRMREVGTPEEKKLYWNQREVSDLGTELRRLLTELDKIHDEITSDSRIGISLEEHRLNPENVVSDVELLDALIPDDPRIGRMMELASDYDIINTVYKKKMNSEPTSDKSFDIAA